MESAPGRQDLFPLLAQAQLQVGMARLVIAHSHEVPIPEELVPRLDIRRMIEEIRKKGGTAPAHSRYDNETQLPISFVTLLKERFAT